MSQRQKKKNLGPNPRPAGIQTMDLKLYERVQQAIRKLAGKRAEATG